MKKLISLLLAVIMTVSVFTVCASAADTCENIPTIIIHGIGQSNVWLTDGKGNYVLDDGEKINCFPCYADVGAIVKQALAPVLLTLLTQHDVGLSKRMSSIVDTIFYMNTCDSEGNESKYVELEEYPYSVAKCSEYEKEQIYSNVPVQRLAWEVGEDHLYYFAYNSFGNTVQIVDRLYKYIEMVKAETGHSKVNLVPISMGGAISNGLLEWYNGTYEGKPSVYESINRIVYIVPALNGSSIVGDVLKKDITFLNMDYLYNGFLEELMDPDEARWIEVALRILPDEVIEKVLIATVDALDRQVIAKCTNMWALCPSEDYDAAAKLWLSDPSMAKIKEQTDMFHTAQLNREKNITALMDMGVEIFDVVDYDFPLYNIGNSWESENGDGIIGVSSTALGAKSAVVGQVLPDGYRQANTYCTDPSHLHLSPDGVVDASTGLLCETTFYFDGQSHEKTARNDIIMKLAVALLKDDSIKDVHSTEAFPQFNCGRDYRGLYDRLSDAYNVNRSNLTQEQIKKLDDAIAEAEEVMNATVEPEGRTDEMEAKLRAVLVEIGAMDAPEEEKEPSDISEKISLWLLDHFGTNGFSEYPVTALTNMFNLIKGIFK